MGALTRKASPLQNSSTNRGFLHEAWAMGAWQGGRIPTAQIPEIPRPAIARPRLHARLCEHASGAKP